MEQKIELILKESIIGAEKKLSIKIDPTLHPYEVIQLLTGALNNVAGQLLQSLQTVQPPNLKLKE